MVDVDDFKAVNDTYGHAAGDATLRAIGAVIRGHVREADLCARYGGDEFVLALAGCDREEAERRSRQLQEAVGDAPLELEGGPGRRIHVTISVGVGVGPEDGRTIEALMAAADRRMYADKAARRRWRQGAA
jgi:diguanylate cyclase (GGDEF)-like protein